MIAMIIELSSTVTSRVKVNNTLSDSFECRNGLMQGESLSPVLCAMHIIDINDALTLYDPGGGVGGLKDLI